MCRCQELNSSPLREQQLLLAAEASLQTHIYISFSKSLQMKDCRGGGSRFHYLPQVTPPCIWETRVSSQRFQSTVMKSLWPSVLQVLCRRVMLIPSFPKALRPSECLTMCLRRRLCSPGRAPYDRAPRRSPMQLAALPPQGHCWD